LTRLLVLSHYYGEENLGDDDDANDGAHSNDAYSCFQPFCFKFINSMIQF